MTSVAKPELVQIKNKSYAVFNRLNNSNVPVQQFKKLSLYSKDYDAGSAQSTPTHNEPDWFDGSEDEVDGNDEYNEYNDDGPCRNPEAFQSFYKFEEVPDCLTIEIPQVFFGFIIGKKGENLKNLMKQTNTVIQVPKSDRKHPDYNEFEAAPIKIYPNDKKGKSAAQVQDSLRKAATRIELITCKNKEIIAYTHYIAINFWRNDQFNQKKEEFLGRLKEFDAFKSDPDLEKNQITKHSHQTVAMCTITSDQDLKTVLDILSEMNQRLKSEDRSPMNLHYKGVNILSNEMVNKAKVLFAKPKDSSEIEWLQQYFKDFIAKFVENGIPTDTKRDRLLNHITLINNRTPRGLPEIPSLDLTEVIEKMKDFDFGCLQVEGFELVSRADKTLTFDRN